MKLAKLIDVLEEISPPCLAEPWDNVGLLVGDPQQDIHRVLLTIDYTPDVAEEREREGCDVVIAYHPPIFDPLKRITAGGTNVVFDTIRRGVAIYSPHTAWDMAEGGTNDMLADILGLTERGPLRLNESKPFNYKLVTFVPADALDRVSQSLFEAGAGRIGNYTSCSFRQPGTGTFWGEEGTRPAIGQSGRLERVEEVRLEMVVPISKTATILAALRCSHPYEEPAFDLLQLAALPGTVGQGRIGTMPPTRLADIIARIKAGLELDHLLVAGPIDGMITRAACGAGACGNLLDDALRQKAQLYLTGEMRHHDAIKAANAGMTVVCTLHSNSERVSLKHLAGRITKQMPDLPLCLSRSDRDPFLIR